MRRLLPILGMIMLMIPMTACSTKNCPELVTYREGLHALDAPVYTQLKQSTQDLVKAGLRNPSAMDVVTLETNRAEAHYQSSRTGDATTQPTP